MMAPATDFAPQLLAKAGQLTYRGPTAAEQQDIEYGWSLAKEMGRFDVPTSGLGKIQSVIAAGAKVLAIEAGKTIVVDHTQVVSLADQHGLAIVSLEQPRSV